MRRALAAAAVLAAAGCVIDDRARPPGGGSSCTALDSFVTPATDAITLLWVVDDSGSMCEEQFNLRDHVAGFLGALRAAMPPARFHMGVVTTDTSSPVIAGRLQNTPVAVTPTPLCPSPPPTEDCVTGLPSPLPKWVDESTPDLERVLRCLLVRGNEGFGGETALGAARMALSPTLLNDPESNAGFFVPGSLVAIAIIGDEDDCSVCSGTACGPLPSLTGGSKCATERPNEYTPVSDFVAYIGNLYDGLGGPLGSERVFSAAIIGLDENGNSPGPQEYDAQSDSLVPICSTPATGSAAPAPRIEAFTRAFPHHAEFSICDPDYGPHLAAMGAAIGTRLRGACLSRPPAAGTTTADLVVFADGAALFAGADYTLACAPDLAPCPAAADATCPTGWRLEIDPAAVSPGARVEVFYAC